MKIAGLEKCSFVDYPGRLAAVVFTAGCNWDCFYCHNRSILGGDAVQAGIGPEIVLDTIETRRALVDAVVITGGEPTIQRGLPQFIRDLRARGFAVKLDTNGSHPTILRALLDEGLLDYVAMDIKAPLAKYPMFCGVEINQAALNESIDLLLLGGIPHEFRTTVAPQLTAEDIIAIAQSIQGADRYVLQQFRVPTGVAEDARLRVAPHWHEWLNDVLQRLQGIVRQVETRGFDLPTQQYQVA